MLIFESIIEKFEANGEKTGWSYIFISKDMAHQIKPNEKRSFRVKGKLDKLAVAGLSLTPVGQGDFILALKADLRKKLKKEAGAPILVSLELDADFKIEMPQDLEICLAEEHDLLSQFIKMPKSHQNYYINWLNSAKTEPTRTKRLAMIINAMAEKLDFATMIKKSRQINNS